MACEISLFLWVTLPLATYINSLRFCFLVQGVALSEWEWHLLVLGCWQLQPLLQWSYSQLRFCRLHLCGWLQWLWGGYGIGFLLFIAEVVVAMRLINSLALVSLPKIRHIHFESVVDPRIAERISKASFHQERLVKEIGYINFLHSSWSEFHLHVIFNMWFSLQMLYIVLT